MITKIELKNIVPYVEGLTIDNLHKINYIYGANASGKTTLSHFLEQTSDEKYKDCTIEWKNGIKVETNVYNRYFRENNFGKSSIPGVFTLGQATKEEKENIDKKIVELEEIKKRGIQKNRSKEELQKNMDETVSEFRENVWKKIFKKYENVFSSAFEGYKASKENFRIKLCDEFSNNKSELKSFEDLKAKAEIVFKKNPISFDKVQSIEFDGIIVIENNSIWTKKVIGKSDVEISKLINRLNISDWVHEGVKHIEKDSGVCPFCQKETIDDDFRIQIEKFFDEGFITDTTTIKHLSDSYYQDFNNIISMLETIETKEKQKTETKLNLEIFSTYTNTLKNQFESNNELISSKIKEPSRGVELKSSKEQLEKIAELINQANQEIENHNYLVLNLREEKEKLKQEIWQYLIEENKEIIQAFVKKKNGLQKGIDNLEKERLELQTKYRFLDSEIKELNKNVTSVQPSVDEINKLLESYGFTNFKIVPTKTDANQYQIQRNNGENAQATLSEGEATFITLLYFLQLIKGGVSPEKVSEKRIVVIDDPISSLDSNVLFVVSSLIKEIVKDIRNGNGNIQQIIVLTHNVYFHKEISNMYIMKEHAEDMNPNYWILRKKNDKTNIIYYEQDNPIKSSYELLWRELREVHTNKNLSCITIQNVMRRILETYFKTLGGYKDDDILNRFEVQQEKEICRSLIYWINDGSHCIPDDLYVEQENDMIEKYMKVFKLIFERLGHDNHYNMMMKM
ncbi:MAG: AAA family ATPase [Paludibacteraceae bacterium]|nr:AAA family ATPase [Paludibacteraceae bacterium]